MTAPCAAASGRLARSAALLLGCAGIVLGALGCGEGEGATGSTERTATAVEDQACSVCGMLVRDQPAPRAQVVHHDGTKAFTCSLGDLLVHLSAPSPHGRADDVWVEVMAPTESPAERGTHAHRWIAASAAFYVVGVERRGIMGPPVLAYAERSHAESVAGMHDGARVVDLAGLEAWWATRQR